jgi:DNA-binding CsgD family transcriptional regulator
MFHEELLTVLIQLIYDAAYDPSRWPVFLEQYAEAIGAPSVVFVVHDLNDHSANAYEDFGYDPAWRKPYEQHYAARNVWMQRASEWLRPGIVMGSQQTTTDAELLTTEFYNDFLRPQDYFYSYGGIIAQEATLTSYLTAMRSKSAGPFQEREFVLLRQLLPHLQTAVRLRQRTAVLEMQIGDLKRTMDRLQQAVFLLDGRGYVLTMNLEAEEILRAGDSLVLDDDGLRTLRAEETRRLRALIAATARTTEGSGSHPGAAMSISRSHGRTPLQALVSPSSPSTGNAKGRSTATLFVRKLEPAKMPDSAVLEQIFSFTPAEVRLATALIAGKTLKQFAAETAVSLNTARTHLKRIFTKAGVSRQAELVLLLTATAPQPKL